MIIRKKMILPISAIGMFIDATVNIAAGLWLHHFYKKGQNKLVGYFSKYFLWMAPFHLSMVFAHFVAPNNSFVLGLGWTIGLFFLYPSLAYLLRVGTFLRFPKLEKSAFNAILVGGIIVIAFNIVYFPYPTIDEITKITHFNTVPIVGAGVGIVNLLAYIPTAIIFLYGAVKRTERYIRIRSLLIGIALIIITIAGPVHILNITATQYLMADTATSLGWLMILIGVLYKVFLPLNPQSRVHNK